MLLGTREVDLFENARGRLEAIAYRILGSATDAQDAVQDTFLRWQAADRSLIDTPEAWLTKALTNLCLNQLTSARVRRETYVGQWLPEPVLAGDRMLGPADTVEQRDSVSIAMLTLMERLSPNERVVYVLRTAFGYPHGEIAEILEITESNCQQIYRRAKTHAAANRARQDVDEAAAIRVAQEFLTAALSGDTDPLIRLLTEDVASVADGGGKVSARREPLVGAVRVARFLRGLFRPSENIRRLAGGTPELFATVVNGGPGVVVVVNQQIIAIFALEWTADGIAAIQAQVNPDKLARVTQQWQATEHDQPFQVL